MSNESQLARVEALDRLRAGYSYAVRGIGANGLDCTVGTAVAVSPARALEEVMNNNPLTAHQARAWVVTRL